MATRAELEAQLEVVTLEEALTAEKNAAKGGKGKASAETKAKLREARLRYRAARDGLEVISDHKGRLAVAEPKGDG